jgi:xylan 1,4-beta-xylosidase
VEAEPENYTHSAGLIFYYNTSSYVYLRTTVRETGGIFGDGDMDTEKVVEVLENDPLTGLRSHGTVPVPAGVPLRLEGSLADDQLHFSWAAAGCPLQPIGPAFNALQLSDDHGDVLRFTGTLVGVAAQDLRDRTFTADFTDFTSRDA